MSVPEKPYTRKEAYLNAAATGDTSGIPETPYTREEMYLDAIARKGGGGGGGGGSSTLSGLTDVDISNPTDGQTLVYNATSGKWENGIGTAFTVTVDPETFRLSMTVREIRDAILSGKLGIICALHEDPWVDLIRGVTTENVGGQTTYVIMATTSQGLYSYFAYAADLDEYPVVD